MVLIKLSSVPHILVAIAGLLGAACFAETLPGTRDPWLWPYSQESIWNKPIGSAARYKPVSLRAAAHAGVDIQHLLKTRSTYPLRSVKDAPTFGPGRCTGTTDLGFSFRVPDTWIVPDAGKSPYGATPNSNFAILMPDADTVIQGCMISRCDTAGPIYLPEWMKWPNNRRPVSVRSDGLGGGGQGASSMSALGGTIRLGELVGDAPIRHAIKINPYAAVDLHYSAAVPGYRWPAYKADNYAATGYNKNADPSLVMGSLLAIPPSTTEQSLGLSTAPGSKLFFTMKYYGVYFTEDAAWDIWDIIVERDVEKEFERVYGFSMYSAQWLADLNRLMKALQVVDNNKPDSIGGGGTPLQPLAPPFHTTATATSKPTAAGLRTYDSSRAVSVQLAGPRYSGDIGRGYDIRGRRLRQSSNSLELHRGIVISNPVSRTGQ